MQSFLMKSTLLAGLLAFGLLHPVSAQNVTFNANHVTLKSAMAQVKKQTGYSFVFKNGAIANLKKVVNIHAKDAPVSQVVDQMLSGEDVSYEIQGKTIIVYRKNGTQQVKQTHEGSKGSRVKVSGKILDSNGDPIIGATIKQKGSSNGTVSDVNGYFSFEAPEGSTLDVTYIGYQPQSLRAIAGREITVSMKEDQESLNEVVVIGYGSQKKSDLTGGVVSVNEEKLNLVTTNNLMDRLIGQVPGLTITTGNAAPGQDQSIRIRGVNSLSASNTPLIVLDGIPYSGSLGDINPDMIENMSVLKDASAAAIYGSRGANGVILIQTKKGKIGKASVTYKGQIGFAETERRLNMMDGNEYVKYLQDFYHLKNGLDYSELTPEKILGADEYANYQAGKQTDWQDVVFRKGYVMNHELSISGRICKVPWMGYLKNLEYSVHEKPKFSTFAPS
jgi:TonB-dependent SusC/RagA subfamily outer membrane receptor